MFSRASLAAAAFLAILTAAALPAEALAQPTIVSGSGYSITFNGNQQAFFSNTWDGTSQQAPNNIALSTQGSTAFASSQYGIGGHLTANVNDGVYGNNRSWLSNLTGTQAYVGIAFPAAQTLSSIAWGRDNGRNDTPTPTGGGDTNQKSGQFTDRTAGTYTLQFTTVASPGTSTAAVDWTTLGTITLGGASGGFLPYFRHEYDIRTSAGEPIAGVTGFRIINAWTGEEQVIDEIEIYRRVWASGSSAVWSSTTAWQTAASGGTSTTAFAGDSLTFAEATASTQALTLGAADRGARSLSFTTTDPVSLTAGGTDRTFTLGWVSDLTTSSGTPAYTAPTLTMAASAGAVTIGSQSAGEQVPLALVLSQTWTNDAANTLTIHNAVSRVASDTTSRTLTLAGSGNYSIGGIANGGAAGTLGLTKSGSGTLTLTGSNSYTGASVFSAGTVAFNSSDTQTLSGALSGLGAIVKDGVGTLAFTGASTHSGTVTINSGTVQLGNTGQSASSRFVLANTAGATLALTGSEATIGLLSGGGTNGGNVQLNGATLRVSSISTQIKFGGVISGTGNVAVVNNALRLAAAQTFSGSASTSGNGILVLEVANTLPATTPLTMSGGRLDIFNRPQTLAGLGGNAGEIYSFTGEGGSGGVLTLDVATGATYSFGGVLGAGFAESAYGFSVVKTGPGTQIFSGSNAYTGATTVSGGSLYINGSLGSSSVVTVQSGGRLGGSGSIGGAVTINSGGVLAPGNSIESLTTGTLSFLNGSTYEYEIDSAAALSLAADFTKALGDLSLAGSVSLSLTDLATSPAAFSNGTTFSLVNYTGSWNNGLFSVGGSQIVNGGTFTVGLNTWQLNYAATSGGSNFTSDYTTGKFVNIVVVPEPGAIALAGIGIALAGWLARRK